MLDCQATTANSRSYTAPWSEPEVASRCAPERIPGDDPNTAGLLTPPNRSIAACPSVVIMTMLVRAEGFRVATEYVHDERYWPGRAPASGSAPRANWGMVIKEALTGWNRKMALIYRGGLYGSRGTEDRGAVASPWRPQKGSKKGKQEEVEERRRRKESTQVHQSTAPAPE